MPNTNRLFTSLALAVALLATASLQAATDPMVPDDTCIFELTGSTAATVSIDGHDYGRQREFSFDKLDRNRFYVSKVQVRFDSGAASDEQIIMRGGWRVRLPLIENSESRPEIVRQDPPSIHDVSADGRWVAGRKGSMAVVWDVATSRLLRTYGGFKGDSHVHEVAFRPGASQIAVGSHDSTALFDIVSGRQLRTIDAHGLITLAMSPDGRYLVTGGYKAIARLWDLDTGALVRELAEESSRYIERLAYSPDGHVIALPWLNDGTEVLWDANSRKGGFKPGETRMCLTVAIA